MNEDFDWRRWAQQPMDDRDRDDVEAQAKRAVLGVLERNSADAKLVAEVESAIERHRQRSGGKPTRKAFALVVRDVATDMDGYRVFGAQQMHGDESLRRLLEMYEELDRRIGRALKLCDELEQAADPEQRDAGMEIREVLCGVELIPDDTSIPEGATKHTATRPEEG